MVKLLRFEPDFRLEIFLEEINSIKEIQVDTSEERVKIFKKDGMEILFDKKMDKKLDVDNLRARWKKKKNILVIEKNKKI